MSKYLPLGTAVTIGSVDIGALMSVNLPDQTRGEAETTDTDSTARTFIAGLRDSGSINLTMRHDPDDAGQDALYTNYNATGAAAIEEIVITLPDTATSGSTVKTYTFDGFVSAAPSGDLAMTDDATAEVTATIRIAGPVTIAG